MKRLLASCGLMLGGGALLIAVGGARLSAEDQAPANKAEDQAPANKAEDRASANKAEDQAPANQAAEAKQSEGYTTERLRGKVVWLDEALARLFNITSEADAEKTQVVLEMADGRLWPLVPDTRGRSFVVDERLRDVELELLVRRYDKAPLVQVIRILKPTAEGTVEVDYWCDICAIPMYILKPCECCQGETRLRERPLSEVFEPETREPEANNSDASRPDASK